MPISIFQTHRQGASPRSVSEQIGISDPMRRLTTFYHPHIRMAYRIRQGRQFNRPPVGLGYAESFLYQIDYLNERDYNPSPVLAKALDILFILHADHEMNASAASALQVGSSGVDPYSVVS